MITSLWQVSSHRSHSCNTDVPLSLLLSCFFRLPPSVSPRHPLIYYAIQHSLLYLFEAERLSLTEGMKEYAMDRAFFDFKMSVLGDETHGDISVGKIVGTNGRSITVVEDKYTNHPSIKDWVRQFRTMGMLKEKPVSVKSCMASILDDVTSFMQ